ncbi:DUF3891 family protein [Dyadobacter subterraneus]|uniref:DUF3891 family protein n=1 Tax=Dyadobacter subterraneus TaxID=2773304 RepID=A0ABR9WLB3_9BACT|nr:DUF3891 family protein [Dyadobacter subterraneus]MBE9464959.1 DUF3891 family protein [Dyadobacter subterraneus]
MIVNYQENGWNIISQRAHGLLAGQICFNWKEKLHPELWMETIVATIEHDDAFNEFSWDESLLNKNGGPLNFKMRNFEEKKCEELLQMALFKSRYIGLLISRHIQFLHENSEDLAARKYCQNLKKLDKKWIKVAACSEEEVKHAYAILQWCDALSLIICQQLIQPENRKIEISTGPGNQCYMLHAPTENMLTVEPWPFEPENFEIHYESKTIAQLEFKNEDEFRQLLLKTEPVLHRFQFAKH